MRKASLMSGRDASGLRATMKLRHRARCSVANVPDKVSDYVLKATGEAIDETNVAVQYLQLLAKRCVTDGYRDGG